MVDEEAASFTENKYTKSGRFKLPLLLVFLVIPLILSLVSVCAQEDQRLGSLQQDGL